MSDTCPFCGCDPYHYEDVGLAGRGVTVGWDDFERIARVFAALRTLGLRP